MLAKVNLDALIPREDFEIEQNINKAFGRNTATIAISDLKEDSFFFTALRKPDFQRETNEWDSNRICDLIESFLDGQLIPAIILWRSQGSNIFVIDGSHRLSALAAWVNDDYGDGKISKNFYESQIPDDQIEIAEKTRLLVRKRIGAFSDFELAVKYPEKVKPEVKEKAKSLGALAIQLQWVEGDSSTAEASFFKINQQAAPIDPTEFRLLKARKKPNGVAARAIIRSGTGHKYWSGFPQQKQIEIEELAKEINDTIFEPDYKNPIKTLDLPIGGKLYSSQTLPLVFDFVNIVNKDRLKPSSELQDDLNGDETITLLNNCKKVARRINSNHPSSLGLHPAVYFYSQTGRHKIASFFAITSLIVDFEKGNFYLNFIKVREQFENLLIDYDYLIQQIVRKYRSASKGYEFIKEFYFTCITKLLEDKNRKDVIEEILKTSQYNYLKDTIMEIAPSSSDFSPEVKSAVFIKEALSKAIKCKICGGYIHRNSISIDHIVRKENGGSGSLENAQLTHPFCNTTIKN